MTAQLDTIAAKAIPVKDICQSHKVEHAPTFHRNRKSRSVYKLDNPGVVFGTETGTEPIDFGMESYKILKIERFAFLP